MNKNIILLSILSLLFAACSRTKTETAYSPSIDSIINEYIQEIGESYQRLDPSHCVSDSTFYVSVCFWRTKDSLRIYVTGCPYALVSPPLRVPTFASIEEELEAYRRGDDFYCPVYGYYNNGKNQWVAVVYSDSIDIPLIQDVFGNRPWHHDKKYREWYKEDYCIDTDMWFYKIEEHKLVLRRKD